MALYNDMRPKTFDEVIGNSAVIKALKKFVKLSPDKRPHTYMFSGGTGCGKTTLARILANEFECSSIDLVELNAANTRGIDTVREVVENAFLLPMCGKSRVYIWDESHQLTSAAQQSLLKVIEDVPIHSYFIFCTTDPNRIIPTIRNRCSTFQVELLSDENMEELLETTLEKINKELSDNIFFSIIDCAEGCPREALVLLETVLSVDDEREQASLLQKALIEHETIELCRALIKKESWNVVAEIYRGLPDAEPEMVRRAILGYMKSVLLKGGRNDNAAFIIGVMEEDTFSGGEPQLIRMLYDICK